MHLHANRSLCSKCSRLDLRLVENCEQAQNKLRLLRALPSCKNGLNILQTLPWSIWPSQRLSGAMPLGVVNTSQHNCVHSIQVKSHNAVGERGYHLCLLASALCLLVKHLGQYRILHGDYQVLSGLTAVLGLQCMAVC